MFQESSEDLILSLVKYINPGHPHYHLLFDGCYELSDLGCKISAFYILDI